VTPQRGEVWVVDFGESLGHEQAGFRPAVVVSADRLNESPAGVLMVVPGTTARRDLPSHIEIEPGDSGLDQVTYAKCEDLKSISEKRLISRLGRVGPNVMFEIGRVLRFLLDL
jgi:mRNA interferase MazF